MNKYKNINKFWINFKIYEFFNLIILNLNYFTHFRIFFNKIFKMLSFNLNFVIIIQLSHLTFILLMVYVIYDVYDVLYLFFSSYKLTLIFYFLLKFITLYQKNVFISLYQNYLFLKKIFMTKEFSLSDLQIIFFKDQKF